MIAPITNGRARTGSRSPFPLWSAKRPSRWPKSSWSKTNGIRPGARLSRPCYRGCWFVSAVATGSIAPRRKPPHAGSITTAALVPTRIVISRAPSATIHRFVRTSLMRVVWKEVVRLLEDPRIIQDELNRRLEAARNADPLKQREDQLRRDHARLAKGMDRLLTGLPGRPGESGTTSLPDAGTPQAGPSHSGRTAVAGDGRRRSNQVSAAGRDARRFPCTIAGAGGDAGRARAAEDPATAGEGGPRGPGNDHHSTFDSDAEFRARSERSTEAASRT